MLSGWRSFYRFALDRMPALKHDPCAGLKAPKSARRLPTALSPDEAVHLVAIEGGDALAVRDRALFELAYSSGLRVSELAGLDVTTVRQLAHTDAELLTSTFGPRTGLWLLLLANVTRAVRGAYGTIHPLRFSVPE